MRIEEDENWILVCVCVCMFLCHIHIHMAYKFSDSCWYIKAVYALNTAYKKPKHNISTEYTQLRTLYYTHREHLALSLFKPLRTSNTKLNHRQTHIIIIIIVVPIHYAQAHIHAERDREGEKGAFIYTVQIIKFETNFILAVHDKKSERNKLPALTAYTRKSPVNKYSKIHVCHVCRCCYCCGGVVDGDGGGNDGAKYEQTIYKCIRQHSYTQSAL